MEDLMSVGEAAKAKGVTMNAVYQAIRDGRLSEVRLGTVRVVRRAEVEAWQPKRGWPKGRKRSK